MTSLQTRLKTVPPNGGFYIAVASVQNTLYSNSGTDSLPNMTNTVFPSTISSATRLFGAGVTQFAAGTAIFRDMGKSLVSSGRSFRKVQYMVSTGSFLVANGTDGVGGVDTAPTNYLTGYIELPSFGAVGGSPGQPFNTSPFGVTPVARLG